MKFSTSSCYVSSHIVLVSCWKFLNLYESHLGFVGDDDMNNKEKQIYENNKKNKNSNRIIPSGLAMYLCPRSSLRFLYFIDNNCIYIYTFSNPSSQLVSYYF